jgi:hypothetical protein
LEKVATEFSFACICLDWTVDIICNETVRVDLLVKDNELLLVLHLHGDDVILLIPKFEMMSLNLLPLATK